MQRQPAASPLDVHADAVNADRSERWLPRELVPARPVPPVSRPRTPHLETRCGRMARAGRPPTSRCKDQRLDLERPAVSGVSAKSGSQRVERGVWVPRHPARPRMALRRGSLHPQVPHLTAPSLWITCWCGAVRVAPRGETGSAARPPRGARRSARCWRGFGCEAPFQNRSSGQDGELRSASRRCTKAGQGPSQQPANRSTQQPKADVKQPGACALWRDVH